MVYARCSECGDEHSIGDRTRFPPDGETCQTTTCPACGSKSYESVADGEGITKPEAERIADAIRDVRGVGGETLENVVNRYGLFVELQAADAEELVEIENVGTATAERIVAAT